MAVNKSVSRQGKERVGSECEMGEGQKWTLARQGQRMSYVCSGHFLLCFVVEDKAMPLH